MYRWKRHVVRRAFREIPRGASVLDIGSGVGWVVNELLRMGARVEGCDIAEPALEQLSARFPSVAFFPVSLGAEPIPRPDAAYDFVTLLEVAFHITDDAQWSRAVGEIGRVLRPGGRLIVTDGFGATDRDPAPHVRFRSNQRWLDAASQAHMRLRSLRPLYRWLSRDLGDLWFPDMPHRVRGAVEYTLEILARRTPHMRIAVFEKA
jgi:SAM-dependent methyltransferase